MSHPDVDKVAFTGSTATGPVANAPQFEKVVGYLDAARAEGATPAYGGAAGESLGGSFNGAEAIDAYHETKSVWVELSGASRDPFTLGRSSGRLANNITWTGRGEDLLGTERVGRSAELGTTPLNLLPMELRIRGISC